MYVCASIWRPEVDIWYYPQPPSTLLLETGTFTNLELAASARLAGHQAPRLFLSLSSQGWPYKHMQHMPPYPDFYMSAGSPNSGTHAYTTTLPPLQFELYFS